jgi:hypothetical protein
MLITAFALASVTTFFSGEPSPTRAHAPSESVAGRLHEQPNEATASFEANDLYASRFRRRAAGYLRLRLMELRAERLERVERAIRGDLSIEELLRRP